MLAVNKLLQTCNEMIGVVSPEDSLDGNASLYGSLSQVSLDQLNMLISELNGQGYISIAQDWVDATGCRTIYFKKLAEGEEAGPDVIDREPPETIDGVSRRIGASWLPLDNMDLQQMMQHNQNSLPRVWNYGRTFEPIPDDPDGHQRCVGVLRLDGHCSQGLRIFLSAKLKTYTLDDTIYLPDAYNNMLIQGLCYKLCVWHDLDSKEAKFDTAFTAAKSLIKRQNITQRMLHVGTVGRSYKDDYEDGVAGYGW